jgi:hypothetical protein
MAGREVTILAVGSASVITSITGMTEESEGRSAKAVRRVAIRV